MRLKLLDLIAFGPFTGTRLDFMDGRGLAVVRGQNEAGKTSALRALSQLLYGMPYRSRDTFLHAGGALAVRGVLDFGDKGELDVTRYKKNKNDLLDDTGAPVPQDKLTALLGGVDKNSFATLFGIDQKELDGGGDDILRSGGALGESLFAAAAGIANMRNVLDRLNAEAEALYTDRGRAGKVLFPLMGEYKELSVAQNKAATSTSRWRDLSREVRRLDRERKTLQKRLDELSRDRSRLERLSQAAAPARRAVELRGALAELGDAALLPEDFFEQRLRAEADQAHAHDIAAQARKALADTRERLQALTVDQAIMDGEAHILELYREAPTHATALRDAEGLARDRDTLMAQAQTLLDALGTGVPLERASDMLPSRVQAAKVRDLATRYEALAAREDGARRQADSLRGELEAARTGGTPKTGADTAELAVLLDRVAGSNPESLLAEARAALAADTERAAADLARLGLWDGTLDAMAAVDMPLEATAQAFAGRMAEADGDLRSAREALTRAVEQAGESRTASAESAAGGEVPSPDELRKVRGVRDRGWSLVRRTLEDDEPEADERNTYLSRADRTVALPDAFESDMREADDLADRLYAGADRVARRMQLEETARRDARRVDVARKRLEACEAHRREVQDEWTAIWSPLGITPLSPAEMVPWLAGWTNIRRRVADLGTARAHCGRLEAEAATLCRAFADALMRMGEPAPAPDAPLASVLALARAARERHDALRRTATEHEHHTTDIAKRLKQAESELAKAGEDKTAWAKDWTAAVSTLGMDAAALPSEAAEVLDTFGLLASALDKAGDKAARIHAIEENFTAFSQEVAKTVERYAPMLADKSPTEAVDGLYTLLSATRDAAKERDRLERDEKRLDQALRDAEADEARHAQTLRVLCGKAQCDTPAALAEAERRSRERAKLEERLGEQEAALAALATSTDVETLAAEAMELDHDQATADIARLDADLEELSAQRDGLNQRLGGARQELAALDGRSEAAEYAERAQSTAADIQVGLDRYVRLRLAESIVRREIERFRQAHQGPVLKHGSRLFKQLTLESFSGLEVVFDEKGEPVLKGVRPTGEYLGVDAMSDGSRDQLYLALRLAGLHRRLENSLPMPFVVDDILVNFDDDRARAALAALAELAGRTQVVFFTHHTHLLELAREAVPVDVLREIHL